MSSDPTGYGSNALMQRAAYLEQQKDKDKDRRQRELDANKARVLRYISPDGFLGGIRKQAQDWINECLTKIEDPTKREEGETLNEVALAFRIHKKYTDMFDQIDKEGREAGKRLKKTE